MKIKARKWLNIQEGSLPEEKIRRKSLICAKEIRCLLTLRKTLVVDERNEALDSSLQREIFASFLT